MAPVPPTIPVAAAVIIRDARVLLTRRPAGTHLEHLWELPGGKIEEGESPPEALRRELREELGVESEIGAPFAFNWHDYGEKRVLLLTYRAEILSGAPEPLGCSGIGWFDAEGVEKLGLPPADGPILEALLPLLS